MVENQKPKYTIEQHVQSNVSMAIDQAGDCGELQQAFASYLQNTIDSVLGDGYSAIDAGDAGDWFRAEFRLRTGCSW